MTKDKEEIDKRNEEPKEIKIAIVGQGHIGKGVIERTHAEYVQVMDDMFKDDVPLAPFIIDAGIDFNIVHPHRPKPNCKKGHNYQKVSEESTCGAIQETWQCRCGKVL